MSDPKENAAPASQQAAAQHPRWKNSSTMTLGTPEAMVICDGLLGMCLTQSGACELGFLAVLANGDSTLEKHQPEITVVAVSNNKPAEVLFRRQWPREDPTFNSATLAVINPTSGHTAPLFLLKDFPDTKDFSKGVDLEHRLNNAQVVDVIKDAFRPRIQVRQGDFHSLLLTPQDYEAVPDGHGGPVIQLGKIAYMTAANLHCNPNSGKVELDIDNGTEFHSWSVKGRKIFVILHNNCQENGRKCIENAPDEETDVHLFYRAVRNPKKYKIKCKAAKPTPPDFNMLHIDVRRALCAAGLVPSEFCQFFDLSLLTTNPTPCGIGGFGEGDSLVGT